MSDDHRYTILSVSVDEKIDEPKRLQENRKLPWIQAFLAGGMHGTIPGAFGIRAIPAFVLVGPDGKIVAREMRGDDIKKEVARARFRISLESLRERPDSTQSRSGSSWT